MRELTSEITSARVVLTCGVSGSGKTCLAKALEEHGFIRVSADELAWRSYGGDFTSLPWSGQQELFGEVRDEIDAELESLLTSGCKVVVDSTMCKRGRRQNVIEICRRHGVEPLLVFLDAGYETLRDRLASRQGKGPNDIVIPDAQLREFCSNFESPGSDEPYVRL